MAVAPQAVLREGRMTGVTGGERTTMGLYEWPLLDPASSAAASAAWTWTCGGWVRSSWAAPAGGGPRLYRHRLSPNASDRRGVTAHGVAGSCRLVQDKAGTRDICTSTLRLSRAVTCWASASVEPAHHRTCHITCKIRGRQDTRSETCAWPTRHWQASSQVRTLLVTRKPPTSA